MMTEVIEPGSFIMRTDKATKGSNFLVLEINNIDSLRHHAKCLCVCDDGTSEYHIKNGNIVDLFISGLQRDIKHGYFIIVSI